MAAWLLNQLPLKDYFFRCQFWQQGKCFALLYLQIGLFGVASQYRQYSQHSIYNSFLKGYLWLEQYSCQAAKCANAARAPPFIQLCQMSQLIPNHCEKAVTTVSPYLRNVPDMCVPRVAFTLLSSSDGCQSINSRADTKLNNNATYNRCPSVFVIFQTTIPIFVGVCQLATHVAYLCTRTPQQHLTHHHMAIYQVHVRSHSFKWKIRRGVIKKPSQATFHRIRSASNAQHVHISRAIASYAELTNYACTHTRIQLRMRKCY